MATAEEYAAWIVKNADKKGTPEFATVAEAYQLAKGGAAPKGAAPAANSPEAGKASSIFSDIADSVATTGAGLGKSAGEFAMGIQRLVGKGMVGLDALAQDSKSARQRAAKPSTEPSTMNRAGSWLVRNAEEGRARMAAEFAPHEKRNPLSALTGEVSGDIATSLLAGGPLVKGAGKLLAAAGVARPAGAIVGALPRAGQAAGVGAIYGGVTGAANSNADTFTGSLGDAGASAATSALLGGITSPVLSGLGAVARNVKGRFSPEAANEYARQKVAQAIARGATGEIYTSGIQNPLVQAANRFTKLGDEAVIADAGRASTLQLLDTLAILPGRTKESVLNLQHNRTAGVGARMRNAAEKALDAQGQRLPATTEALAARRALDSAPLYAELRRTDITPSPELIKIVEHADRLGALQLGKKIATGYQQPFLLDQAPPVPNGITNQIGKWRMNDLDHIKQGLDDLVKSATKPDGTVTSLGRSYMELRSKLIGELDAATTNPQTGESLYRNARKAFSDPSDLMDAADAGKKAISQGEAAIDKVTRGMSDNERQAFRIGAFEGLREKLGYQGGQTEIMSMWKNPTMQERLRAVFGSKRAYQEFAADVAREARLKQIQGVAANSKTAERLAAMSDMDTAALKDAAGAVAGVKSGNPLAAFGSAKNAWNRVATPEAVRDRMGQILLMRGPDAQREMNALEALVRRINDQNLQLSTRVGVLGGAAGSSALAPVSPVQIPQR